MSTHTRRRSGPALGWVGVAAVLVLAVATLAGAAGSTPAATPVVGGVSGGAASGGGAGVVAVAGADAARMDEVYADETQEVVYCGRVADGALSIDRADVVERGPGFARFDASSCRDMGTGATTNVHTHPGGAASLSTTDRLLLASDDYRYVCVQHGAIAVEAGEEPGLACYEDDDGTATRVPVDVER